MERVKCANAINKHRKEWIGEILRFTKPTERLSLLGYWLFT